MEPRRGFIFGLVCTLLCFAHWLDVVGALQVEDLVLAEQYDIDAFELPPGDENVQGVHLETSVHLYSGVYDFIYINTNGILTFGSGYPDFLNQPLPIEFPAIAPFYTNVDTSASDPGMTSITYFESSDSRLMRHLEASLYGAFPLDENFEAVGAFVVTWANVGHFDKKDDRLNTFQAIIVSSFDKTYVQFLYPKGGLNWIQADIGQSGLVDVRAQAGFVSEDGRFTKLPGSGTDNAKYLDVLSNYDENGSWWYLVGPIAYPNDVIQPHSDDHLSGLTAPPAKQTCATHGLRCHVTAHCTDTATGFCCSCRNGYYGNGFTCLKSDAPIRVSGRVYGSLGDVQFDTQLQAYVTLLDGQTFAAVTPLEAAVGQKLQLLQLLAGPIGWLFALPMDGAQNGYQLTGGRFNHSTTIRFHGSDRQVTVVQRYSGLNVWDQLEVDVVVNGDLPDVPADSRVEFPDIVEEFVYAAENTLRSIGTMVVHVGDEELLYSVVQQIEYETCAFAEATVPFTDRPAVFNRVFRVTATYKTGRENALRIGQSNKITRLRDANACSDGTAKCGENTQCIAGANDSFDCVCLNGFLPSSSDQHSCGDIDECADATHICHANAICINQPGGYSCQCAVDFHGNGFDCQERQVSVDPATQQSVLEQPSSHGDVVLLDHNAIETEPDSDAGQTSDAAAPSAVPLLCQHCASHADCVEGTCVCQPGFFGDGVTCSSTCDEYSVWSNDRCVPVDANAASTEELDDNEVQPFCHMQGCSCPTGYELDETAEPKTCHRMNADLGDQKEDVKLPCDVENQCSPNASCEFIESLLLHKCVCKEGFVSDGDECVEQVVSCNIENNCHELARCVYDENIGMSVCRCDKGYEGDGIRHCEPEPECRQTEQCGANAVCSDEVCVCIEGYEKGHGDLCVLAGACGGAYCAENARCEWDHHEQISYCQCLDGYRGDGVRQCVYVPPPCNVVNNCGLNAACAPDYRNPALYLCVCNGGYSGDGFVCAMEENCQNTPSLCHPDAQCVSATTGLQCVCNTGFLGNGTHCAEPPRFDADFLLVSRGLSAIRVSLSAGKANSRPVFMSNLMMGLDKDCAHGRVYWSDNSAPCIWSARYDGTDKRAFISTDIQSPEGVAVDWISRRLYWTDSQKDTIEVASLDDPARRAVIARKNLVNPRGIAVDPHSNKIFWSDWNRLDPKIEWANLDGSEREVLLAQPHVRLPNHVAISPRTRDLCFADAGTKKVECIDTYRKQVHTMAANLSYPFALAITDTQFYWTDWHSKSIETVDHSTKRLPNIQIPYFPNHRMFALAAITDDCPLFYSPCQVDNGGCAADRMCLVNRQSSGGRTCKCLEKELDCSDEDDYSQ